MGWLNRLHARFRLARRLPRHWRLRPRTLDRRIAYHVLVENEYRLPGPIRSGDIVLDVGSHVGTFALAALRAGAGLVHCFEPDEDNYRLLAHNLAPFPAARLHRAAVWRSDEPEALVHLHNPLTPRNTGACRIAPPGLGQPVAAVALDALIDEVTAGGKRVRLLKLDCEGAEWPVLLTSRRLERVDALCGEYHLGTLPEAFGVAGCEVFGPGLLKQALVSQGYRVTVQPLPPRPQPCGLFFAVRDRE